jgi:hypothetical protein
MRDCSWLENVHYGATSLMARWTYTRYCLDALMVRVSLKALRAIDRRTAAARAMLDFRRDLLDDLGGEVTATAAQLALVDVAARTRLYLDHVDAVLLERASLVVRRTRLLPSVEQRGRLADSLSRILGQLGLERRQPAAKPRRVRGRAIRARRRNSRIGRCGQIGHDRGSRARSGCNRAARRHGGHD